MTKPNDNASFYYFKTSGKWKYEGRGYVSQQFFGGTYDQDQRRTFVLRDNNYKWPGVTSVHSDPGLHVIIILDPHVNYGWPYMLPTKETA